MAVIDECQMIADRERGFAWTRAILGVLAPEVHLCAAPEARDLLIRIIESTGDTWEEIHHLRKTPLVCMRREIDFDDVKPGDALITFSKLGVLSVAEDLRAHGKEPAIIYGALPYSTRRRQMEGFLEGRMQYVVSTDAIGMGLNLPIRRVIFLDTRKFDGVERRDLKPAEIQQIAGRAGRYGMYDKGYVGATENLDFIREGLEAAVPPLETAVAGFSELVLQLEQYCRKLDLYFSFSKAFGCPIDRDALYDKREDAAESINQILLYNLKNNIRFCARCGAALPLHQSGRLCQSCYRKISALRRPTRW